MEGWLVALLTQRFGQPGGFRAPFPVGASVRDWPVPVMLPNLDPPAWKTSPTSPNMSEPSTLLYLSRADVEAVDLPMAQIIEAVHEAFVEKGSGRAEMPPKPGIHPSEDGFIHAMPAYLSELGGAGLKWVSAFPENKTRGIPQITGLIVLNDASNGLPIAVMDCTWITAMRTAAATAVAARYLARPESTTLGIIGCGVQGRTNLEALLCEFPIERVHAYDHRASNSARYVDEMSVRHDVGVVAVSRPEEAVRDMDLIVTGGPIRKSPDPVIQAGWMAPGAFGCALDFDSYWSGPAMREIDLIATDDQGQLEYFREIGYFKETPVPGFDLGQLAASRRSARTTPGQRALSINLGLAIEDIVTAQAVVARATEREVGKRLLL